MIGLLRVWCLILEGKSFNPEGAGRTTGRQMVLCLEKSPCTLAEPTGGVDQRFYGGFGVLPSDKKVQTLGVMTLSRRGLPQESPVFDWQHSDEKPRGMDTVEKKDGP